MIDDLARSQVAVVLLLRLGNPKADWLVHERCPAGKWPI
jgi:hypothetical protein